MIQLNSVDWPVMIAGRLADSGVSVAAYVPDSRLDGILVHLGLRGILLRSLTREEECVAYGAGQRMADKRCVVLLQSSGLGNALNVLGSLVVPYRLGLPLIISMRGTLGEKNPSQVPMGRATIKFLDALGIQSFSIGELAGAEAVLTGALDLAYKASETVAVILEPQLGTGSESE